MRQLAISLFLLLAPFARAKTSPAPWYDQVRELYNEDQTDRVLKELRSDSQLPKLVCEALKSGRHEAEALEIAARLQIVQCWPEIFNVVKSKSAWMAVVTAESLNRTQPRAEWKAWLNEQVSAKNWPTLSGEMKLAILPALDEQKVVLSGAQIQLVLNDEASDVREQALANLEQALVENPDDKTLQKTLRESLTMKPYQFRLAAYQSVARLPLETRKSFRAPIDQCVKTESQTRVKDVCLALQKSF